MPTKTVSAVVAGLPAAIDVPAQLLLLVKTVYPAATTAYPWATLEKLEAATASQTLLTARVTYP